MAFSDPQTVTINSIAIPLPRTSSGPSQGSFTSADGSTQLTVSTIQSKRRRAALKLTTSKIVPDPLISDRNTPVSASITLVCDSPLTGYSATDLVNMITALGVYVTASSGARAIQFVGGEN
jgi:hypothetical protein